MRDLEQGAHTEIKHMINSMCSSTVLKTESIALIAMKSTKKKKECVKSFGVLLIILSCEYITAQIEPQFMMLQFSSDLLYNDAKISMNSIIKCHSLKPEFWSFSWVTLYGVLFSVNAVQWENHSSWSKKASWRSS